MKVRLLLLLLSVVTTVCAESITIRQKSGNETILELSTNPVITFEGENMVVTNDFTTISIPLDDIDDYQVGAVSGIHETSAAPQYRDGHIIFTGIKENTSASVHTLDGKAIGGYAPDSSGILDINMGSLPKGAFIISTPNNKIKVINK